MYPVKVYLYDLSHGMMATMSPALLGIPLEGLWHTSIVVYGVEYYFGGGIQKASPGTTPAGLPTRVMDYGATEVPQEMFEDFLEGIRDHFHADTYHLLQRNCNHFTQEALEMLTSKDLPATVKDLPDQFLSTPLGQMLSPMIDSFFKNMAGQGAPV